MLQHREYCGEDADLNQLCDLRHTHNILWRVTGDRFFGKETGRTKPTRL